MAASLLEQKTPKNSKTWMMMSWQSRKTWTL